MPFAGVCFSLCSQAAFVCVQLLLAATHKQPAAAFSQSIFLYFVGRRSGASSGAILLYLVCGHIGTLGLASLSRAYVRRGTTLHAPPMMTHGSDDAAAQNILERWLRAQQTKSARIGDSQNSCPRPAFFFSVSLTACTGERDCRNRGQSPERLLRPLLLSFCATSGAPPAPAAAACGALLAALLGTPPIGADALLLPSPCDICAC